MLDIGLNQVDTSILPSKGWAPDLPASASERMALEFKAYRLGSMSYAEEFALHDAYEKSIEKVRTATGENIANPLNYPPHEIPAEFFTVFGKNTPSRGKQELTLGEAIARAREIDPSIPTIEETKQGVRDRAKAAVNEAFAVGEVSSPWTGPAAFLGTISGAMTDPINLASLPLGAPARLSGSVALRTLKAMAIEGAIGAGSQAAIELTNKEFQTAAGIESSSLANILAAGIGGSVLAGGLRGLSEFISSRAASKLGLTLDQLDSLAVTGRHADDVATAPKGVDVETHLNTLNDVTSSVSQMRPFSKPVTTDDLLSTTSLSRVDEWEPAPVSRGRQIRSAAAEETARVKNADPKIADDGALGEARRIAATDDPVVYSSSGAGRKASDVLQEAAEKKRVANEIANACLLAGAIEL